ncbi:hypothetical protein JHV56_10130 [Arthrobacter sp. BHU FT2]|nr:hypothetical protein [Arthrobacter sp. BHU FT2]
MPSMTALKSNHGHPIDTHESFPFNYLIDDWTILPGSSVEIRKGAVVVRRGWVEDATQDGGILWLSAGQGEPRRLYEKAAGFHVWAASEQTALVYQDDLRRRSDEHSRR